MVDDSPSPSPCPSPPPPPLFPLPSSPTANLSEEQRYAIVTLHRDGRDHTYIQQHVGCDVRSIKHWIEHYDQYGDVSDAARAGHPPVTTALQDAQIVQTAKTTKFTTPRAIKNRLKLNVSRRTIDRRLIQANLFGRVARKKRKVSALQISKRLKFANKYKQWKVKDWKRVIYADAKKLPLGLHGQEWVRRPPGEAFNPEYTIDHRTH